MEKAAIPVNDRVLAVVADVKVDQGARLLVLRRRFKKTLADVSASIGLHEHRLSEMERGLREVDPAYVQYIDNLLKG
jgi:hypothetical protein